MNAHEERFWNKVDKDGPVPEHMPHLGKCWVWTACINDSGYGIFTVKGQNIRAHRFSYLLYHNTIPDDKPFILHKCDNPACVRPQHLWAGTHSENMQDAVQKKRLNNKPVSLEARKKMSEALKGKRIYSKLDWDTVQEIRKLIILGDKTYGALALAARYNVCQTTILNIYHYKTWIHE